MIYYKQLIGCMSRLFFSLVIYSIFTRARSVPKLSHLTYSSFFVAGTLGSLRPLTGNFLIEDIASF